MPEFTVTIVERPRLRTAGLKVRTTMGKASEDCPRLWTEEFEPRMADFPADPAYAGQSYGVSVMVDADSFDYWAVMPLAPGAALPEGMAELDIPGGFYAECPIGSLAELPDAFTHIYSEWGGKQEGYALDMNGIGYELYTCEFMKTGALTLYCALKKK
jgi:AraC family transcriptional regulator